MPVAFDTALPAAVESDPLSRICTVSWKSTAVALRAPACPWDVHALEGARRALCGHGWYAV